MPSIELNSVTLQYPILFPPNRLLKSRIGRFQAKVRLNGEERTSWIHKAIDNVTISVAPGVRLGLVGRNGAGKTTLLKIIAGVFKPTSGTVRREGVTATLLNPNIGLDYEATGYENVILLGRMAGLSEKALLEKIPEIEDFTELGEFLDMPLYTYSAGMQMRLAFAVATMSTPEIILADENIGAGDALFVHKARRRLVNLYQQSNIVVLATHSQAMMEELCTRALLLDRGRLIGEGSVSDVFKEYLKSSALNS